MRHDLALGALFLLAWPLFFGSNIYPRYVYAGVALAIVALVAALDRALGWGGAALAAATPWSRRLAIVALLLPAAVPDALPRQLAFLARYARMDRERYFVLGPPEWRMARDLWLVSQHRRRLFPGAGYFEHTALLDMEGSYLLDSAGFRLYSRELQLLELKQGGADCPWATLRRLDVAYLRTRFKFELWPDSYRSVVPLLTAIDPSSRILYLDPQLLAARAAAEPGCASAATRSGS